MLYYGVIYALAVGVAVGVAVIGKKIDFMCGGVCRCSYTFICVDLACLNHGKEYIGGFQDQVLCA